MLSFRRIIASLEAEGYANGPAQAKLAHDVILKALETCGFGKNVTVKGGVVMSTITGDIRRATMDMDIDFVNYSLSNGKIDAREAPGEFKGADFRGEAEKSAEVREPLEPAQGCVRHVLLDRRP